MTEHGGLLTGHAGCPIMGARQQESTMIDRSARISYSTTVWSRAVVIDVDDAPAIAAFRGELSRIAGAAILAPPHISLLYTVDDRGQRPGWAASETRLRAITEDCAARVEPTEFVLGDPTVVAPDGDWTNIRSWKVVRSL